MPWIMCCAVPRSEVVTLVLDAYNRNADTGVIKPTCPGLADTVVSLKKRNKKLAIVTTDLNAFFGKRKVKSQQESHPARDGFLAVNLPYKPPVLCAY